ncbi:PREDICTED: uncharacterized protein LOC105456729 [Wasmannia auropunctata]|uniref:uncharacterized protein LOC105456729 n=1 Tax=Wasmannia auropunctata TaxID=64793 RepID=UPI0005EDC97D|nr:PREDICTED: uncharacterized protein LOC105456729 [Wasmannia auropunctata]
MRGSAWADRVFSLAARGIQMEKLETVKLETDVDTEIKIKTEAAEEVSDTRDADNTTDVARFLDSRSTVFTTNKLNNATVVGNNTLFRSQRNWRRRRKKKKNFPSNLAFNHPAASTAPQATASTSVHHGVKRPYSSVDGFAPNSAKKLKVFDERLQTVDHRLIRAIVSTDNAPLGPEQLTLFRGAVSREIDKIVGGPVPKFYDSYVKFDAIVVRCVDDASLRWLSLQIGRISPWPEAKLKMIAYNDLQRCYRACVWIPGPHEATGIVLQRLNRQNPCLNTASWRIFAENGSSKNGRSLFLGMPESDFRRLESLNFRAYLGLGQVNFAFTNVSQESSVASN